MKNHFGSLLTAMVTPFDKNGNLELEKAANLANNLQSEGSDGVVLAGTTGESPTLNKNEKLSLFDKVVKETEGLDIIAGTGSNSTKESVELTKEAESTGVNGIMLVVPYYNKPPQEGLYEHFKTIAAATSLPIILYNVPGRTGVSLLPETVKQLAEIENIVALKDATKDLEYTTAVCNSTPEGFAVYSGDDAMTLPLLSVGGHGVISVVSHLAGEEMKEIIEKFHRGQMVEASQKFRHLFPLFKAMFLQANPIPVKEALNIMGKEVGKPRLPLKNLPPELKNELTQILRSYRLLE